MLVAKRTNYNYFPGSERLFASFAQGPTQEKKNIDLQLIFFNKTKKTEVKENKKKWDSQSGGSKFTTPGSEGLLVIEEKGKPIGVTYP